MKPVAVIVVSMLLVARVWSHEPTWAEVEAAIRRSVSFQRDQLSRHGGYCYYTSDDLKTRWGEGVLGKDSIVVQPPGTPTVGLAFLRAYHATGDEAYLQAALEAAQALVAGQLKSGGWMQLIHFSKPARGTDGNYRHRPGGTWNASSLDDDQTTAALRFLMQVDRAFKFRPEKVHEAVDYGLKALLKAQFPHGGFPQIWSDKPRISVESRAASFPDYNWKTEHRPKNYWDYPTLNDGLAGHVAETLRDAWQINQRPEYDQALRRLGDFLILAQLPEPQPAWAQQYTASMQPMWARKFEPPAVSGLESQDAIRALILIARTTREAKYLKPIPAALSYLERSQLPDGQLARFYELRSNKPLYMTAAYELTYSDDQVPPHYGWKHPARLKELRQAYDGAVSGSSEPPPPRPYTAEIQTILNQLDDRGAWVSRYAGERLVGQPGFKPGQRYISSAVFAEHLQKLCSFLRPE